MRALDKALDYLACPRDMYELIRGKDGYRCRACNAEYPIIDGTPSFSTMPSDSAADESALKETIGEKASSNVSLANEISGLAKIYAPLGQKKAILKLVSGGLEIIKEYGLNETQTAMLQQAITEARYDIEASDYRGTFVLPVEYMPYVNGNRFVFEGACGPGEGIASLTRIPFRIGLDISLEMAKRAQKSFGSDELLYVQGDVCRLPVRSNSAGVYMSFNALDRVPRLSRMASEMSRVLTPDGVCILGACEPPQYEYRRNGVIVTYVPEKERLQPEEMLKMADCSFLGKKEFPWKVSTVLDETENLITTVYLGRR